MKRQNSNPGEGIILIINKYYLVINHVKMMSTKFNCKQQRRHNFTDTLRSHKIR